MSLRPADDRTAIFRYTADLQGTIESTNEDTFEVQVPWSIRDANELLRVLWAALRLPGYFGFNWDALDECLRDFHWIAERRIVLVHTDLPMSLDVQELTTYLNILADAIGTWAVDDSHEFVVVFPEEVQPIVTRIFNTCG